jgi:hypothetical protein
MTDLQRQNIMEQLNGRTIDEHRQLPSQPL